MRVQLKFETIVFVAFVAVVTTVAMSTLAGEPAEADGPKCSFVGVTGSGKRVAYVVNAGGGMLSIFDTLRAEIARSVDGLKPEQWFNVVFFRPERFEAADRKGVLPATPENKRRVREFLDKFFPLGTPTAMPGLEFAFKQEVELVYLLADGDLSAPGNDAVVKYCNEQTKAGKTKINTIAVVYKESKEKPENMEFVKALQAIAKNSGGRFRIVSADDLGR